MNCESKPMHALTRICSAANIDNWERVKEQADKSSKTIP